jgi:hypothetical protein
MAIPRACYFKHWRIALQPKLLQCHETIEIDTHSFFVNHILLKSLTDTSKPYASFSSTFPLSSPQLVIRSSNPPSPRISSSIQAFLLHNHQAVITESKAYRYVPSFSHAFRFHNINHSSFQLSLSSFKTSILQAKRIISTLKT